MSLLNLGRTQLPGRWMKFSNLGKAEAGNHAIQVCKRPTPWPWLCCFVIFLFCRTRCLKVNISPFPVSLTYRSSLQPKPLSLPSSTFNHTHLHPGTWKCHAFFVLHPILPPAWFCVWNDFSPLFFHSQLRSHLLIQDSQHLSPLYIFFCGPQALA